jgi:hypothetical protein
LSAYTNSQGSTLFIYTVASHVEHETTRNNIEIYCADNPMFESFRPLVEIISVEIDNLKENYSDLKVNHQNLHINSAQIR